MKRVTTWSQARLRPPFGSRGSGPTVLGVTRGNSRSPGAARHNLNRLTRIQRSVEAGQLQTLLPPSSHQLKFYAYPLNIRPQQHDIPQAPSLHKPADYLVPQKVPRLPVSLYIVPWTKVHYHAHGSDDARRTRISSMTAPP